ncbi:hypothetical protein [Pontibacter chitinilyticus]|uniref:hypothetical protein n=1 Tax=Pontibacter chitinilyticus TaxID=2674989 RepID=UPI0032199C72
MLDLIILAVGGGFAYFVFKPLIKHPGIQKKFFHWFLAAYFLVLLATTAANYLIEPEQPTSFKAGVALVKNDKDIQQKIGEFKTLKFNKKDFPGETDDPATLKFELVGSKGILFVESKVAKSSDGNWYLMEITKQSLLRKY